ncbi:unnamed protein product [Paramecium primaurelia]|uniref:Uncharacterized protein n=1 Tax=Paramecium primaurelia TaxID=5886 RepID=A0A8S1MYS6_PARPR|nr:unnamed protein product [Paramecium primaurelia]
MFKKINEHQKNLQDKNKKIQNYQYALKKEKQLLGKFNRDYIQIYNHLKFYFEETFIDYGIFAQQKGKQKFDYIRTTTKFFEYLLINDKQLIEAEDIVNFVKVEKKINVNALLQYANQQLIMITDQQLNEIRDYQYINGQDKNCSQQRIRQRD